MYKCSIRPIERCIRQILVVMVCRHSRKNAPPFTELGFRCGEFFEFFESFIVLSVGNLAHDGAEPSFTTSRRLSQRLSEFRFGFLELAEFDMSVSNRAKCLAVELR